jgi:Asp-tRNA(Asn)/Glu-tRNA(Gln) amidotransferase A subunit family amidase
LLKAVDAVFNDGVDAIVTPTVPMSAPRIPDGFNFDTGESNTPLNVAMLKYVFVGNFLGLPGVSVPVGFDEGNGGMPLR